VAADSGREVSQNTTRCMTAVVAAIRSTERSLFEVLPRRQRETPVVQTSLSTLRNSAVTSLDIKH